MLSASRFLVFTDLDGTLIDFETYSTDVAKPTLRRLADAGVPVVFCSSKTIGEQLSLQEAFGVTLPCIVENGSAIVSPVSFWQNLPEEASVQGDWTWIPLGLPAKEIRRRIGRIESEIGESLMGFSSMATEDVATLTGLDLVSARRAQARDFSETLAVSRPDFFWAEINPLFAAQGLSCVSGGRFRTVVSAACDKGKAVRKFVDLLARDSKRDDLLAIGIGDGPNDRDLLLATDVSYQVMTPERVWREIDAEDVVKVNEVGPRGWVKAISALLGSPEFARTGL